MNKCILMGRLTKDAEIREASNTTVVRFTLAVDRRFAKEDAKQTADFISCVAFGKTAEFIGKYGLKGTKFVVEGHIHVDIRLFFLCKWVTLFHTAFASLSVYRLSCTTDFTTSYASFFLC